MDQQQLKAVFEAFDQDNSGFIDATELHAALQKAGKSTSMEDATSILAKVDTNSDAKVSFSEFEAIFALAPDALPMGVQQLVEASNYFAATLKIVPEIITTASRSISSGLGLAPKLPDMEGTWLLTEIEGDYDKFLVEIGISWMLRKVVAGMGFGKGRDTNTISELSEASFTLTSVNAKGTATVTYALDGAERSIKLPNDKMGPATVGWEDGAIVTKADIGKNSMVSKLYLLDDGKLCSHIVVGKADVKRIFTKQGPN